MRARVKDHINSNTFKHTVELVFFFLVVHLCYENVNTLIIYFDVII